MRLRPSGQSGALVTSVGGFEKYQFEKAWVWEHQALVRARPVAGPGELQQRFNQIRKKVLCRERDAESLRKEIFDMRNKMRETQATNPEGEFNLKHDPGGIVDIEFMVQYGVLLLANKYPDLVETTNNYELLSRLSKVDFIDDREREQLQSTYHYFLGMEYQRKLTGKPSIMPRAELAKSPEPVQATWRKLFEES